MDNNKPVPGGVWSAAPTPLDIDMKVHAGDVRRMLDHHLRLGIDGLFLAGTNGEGPWLPDREKSVLVRTVTDHVGGRLPIAVQVTDNSAARIADNMTRAADDGADIAVIAPPSFFMNATADTLKHHYIDAIDTSPLPVGIYDRGSFGAVTVPLETLEEVYRHPKVVLVKDSSTMDDHATASLAARSERPELTLLNGDEFDCARYLERGYDGLLLGGGVFNGHIARLIFDAARSGDMEKAGEWQKLMNDIMYTVYGGRDISCWLSGEKYLLVRLGIITTSRNFPRYPLHRECMDEIDRMLAQNRDLLLPDNGG